MFVYPQVYGAYEMKLNSLTVHFFVMNNIFFSKDEHDENVVIHEKYDIKGSTVNRSSAPPVEGQVCTCKNCEQKFVYTRSRSLFRGRRFGLLTSGAAASVSGEVAASSPRTASSAGPVSASFRHLPTNEDYVHQFS